MFNTNGDQKKAGVAILISDKIDFEIKAVKRDNEGHYKVINSVLWTVAHLAFPGKDTGVGCYFLLHGIFSKQEWNIGLLH